MTGAVAVFALALAVGASDDEAMTARLDGRIGEVARAGFSGTVLVARGDRVLLERGYGESRGGPPTVDSRYWIASIGKQFTSAAVLALAETGALALDDRISRHLGEVPAALAEVTVDQLLAHVSGLPSSYAGEGTADRESAVRACLGVAPEARPGERFRYSNVNYMLAAAVVEVVSGAPYERFVHERLLARGGLRATGQANDGVPPPGIAPVSGALPPRLVGREWGGQRFYSTASDLWRWYRALVSGRILAPAWVARLFEPVSAIQEGFAARGWFLGREVAGERVRFVRGNEEFGANALLYAYPACDLVVVVLTHAGDRDAETSWSRAVLAEIEAIALPTCESR